MADGGREIPQIAGPPVDGRGHLPEVVIEGANLDGRRDGGVRRGPASGRHLLRRPAEGLDGSGDAPGDQTRQNHQQAQGQDQSQAKLDPVFIEPAKQGPGRARQQQDAHGLASDLDGPGMMDADGRGAAQPFETVARPVVAIAAQDGARRSAQGRHDFRQASQGAALAMTPHHHPLAVQHEDRGQGRLDRPVDHRRHQGCGSDGRRIGSRPCHGGRPLGQDRGGAEVDGGALWPIISVRPRVDRPLGRGAGPVGGGHGRQDGALSDQLRLGLADQGVFIDPQEQGARHRHGGHQQQHGQQDGPQPQGRPVAFGEVLDGLDHEAGLPPMQGPRR